RDAGAWRTLGLRVAHHRRRAGGVLLARHDLALAVRPLSDRTGARGVSAVMARAAMAAHQPRMQDGGQMQDTPKPQPATPPPAAPRRRAYVETYGCQMNQSDGELMQGVLAAHGYEITRSPEDADVVLVNTCAIREHAEQRVIGRVGELSRLKRENPGLVIGVT